MPNYEKTRRLAAPGSFRGNSRGFCPERESGFFPCVGRKRLSQGEDPVKAGRLPKKGLKLANIPERPKRRARFPLSDEAITDIWARLRAGDHQHDIAADYGVNGGRVSEINTGKRGNHITGLPPR